MKKLFFIVGLLSLLTFFSCQNEENVYYSCDEAEDALGKGKLIFYSEDGNDRVVFD